MSTFEDQLGRLASANIELLPTTEMRTHFVFERGGFVCLVERRGEGFGSIGAPGLMTERGFAPLVWRDGSPYFQSKGFEQRAEPEQVEALRGFSRDLKAALA